MKCARQHKTMSFTGKLRPLIAASAACLLLAGCATGPKQFERATLDTSQQDLVASKPAALQSYYRDLYAEGRRNEVLNLMEIGTAAYRLGLYSEAKSALDEARLNIESVYADNDAARKARSIWYEETEKEFKGEAYERCMVYFYLGLIFLQEGDYGNARASFISGLLQDAFAEEEQHSADFASLLYLAGWSARLMGSETLAQEHFRELQLYRPDAPLPGPDDNVLLIAETGTSPRKLADGVGHYQLVYRRGKDFKDTAAVVRIDDSWTRLYPIEDVYFQASTRGGRAIDRIVKGQVEFKTNAREFGTSLSEVSRSNWLAGASAAAGGALGAGYAAVSLVSVAAQGLSASAVVRADTRYWDGLPDTVHLLPMHATANEGLTIRYLDSHGIPVGGLSKRFAVHMDANGNGVAFASSR